MLLCHYAQVVYLVNSGSEANDLALMLARAYTRNFDIIALRNGYHGMSAETMGLCGQHTWKQPIPQGFGVRHAMTPDPYRGPFGNDGKRCVCTQHTHLAHPWFISTYQVTMIVMLNVKLVAACSASCLDRQPYSHTQS